MTLRPPIGCVETIRDRSLQIRNQAMRLTVNKRIYKPGEEVPDDEVPIPLREYAYADGDINNLIPDDGDDSVAGEIVEPKKAELSPLYQSLTWSLAWTVDACSQAPTTRPHGSGMLTAANSWRPSKDTGTEFAASRSAPTGTGC
jgi:hypothetical protein